MKAKIELDHEEIVKAVEEYINRQGWEMHGELSLVAIPNRDERGRECGGHNLSAQATVTAKQPGSAYDDRDRIVNR